MLTIKIVYNENCKELVSEISDALYLSAHIEAYNEDNYKDKKKAIMIKASCGTRKVPFIAVYNEDKELIRAFYDEVKECTKDNFFDWYKDYLRSIGKSGQITITKISDNEGYLREGQSEWGRTKLFVEGASCYIDQNDRWYRTSVIQKINWENNTFETLNSTYKFKLIEDKKDVSKA